MRSPVVGARSALSALPSAGEERSDPAPSRGAEADGHARYPRTARAPRGELAGTVRIRRAGREYRGWYRAAEGLLTVRCGVASSTGRLPDVLPSPTPFAERLLRDLVDAEHPGLNPE